jgi:hypothetical protein
MSRRKWFSQKPARMVRRPFLEELENRLAPAAVSWTGMGGDLNWSDKMNWSNMLVPTSSDDVTINIAVAGAINVNGGAFAVRSLNDTTAALAIAPGGSLSLAAVAAISTFGQSVTVSGQGSLSVGADATIQISPHVTLTDNGTLTFASGDSVNLAGNVSTQQIVVGNGGLFTATSSTFTASGFENTGLIIVKGGGHLMASNTTFDSSLNQLDLNSGSILNAGDFSGNSFDCPLYLPENEVQFLSGAGSNNAQFQAINILAGSVPSGQTLTLGAIGNVTTNLVYVFPGAFTVSSGATLTVAAGLPVTLQLGVTLTDNGTLTFGSGDTVTLVGNISTQQILIGNGGTLHATSSTFTATGFENTGLITVNGGGHLMASNTTFDSSLNKVYLNNGSILNAGDLSGNSFNCPLYLPENEVQFLSGTGSNNAQFQAINILAGSVPSGQTLALNAIGTATTANLVYIFPNAFTVSSGATLTVAAGLPVTLQLGVTLTDNGIVTFGSGDTVTLVGNISTQQILIGNGGMLTATSSTFTATGFESTGLITVNGGGHLKASNSTFASSLNQVYLNSGSILNAGDFSGNSFNCPLYLPENEVQFLSGAGSNNAQFQAINILAGSVPSGQTLALNAIGTATTANLVYIFPSAFTVMSGGTLTVAAGLPVTLQLGVTLTDNGTVTFGSGDTVTLVGNISTQQILIGNGGTLTATSSTFTAAGFENTGLITIVSGGTLQASNCTVSSSSLTLNVTGTLTTQGNVTIQNLTVSGGTVTISGTLTVTGMFLWTGGTINGTSTDNLVVQQGATLSGANNKVLDTINATITGGVTVSGTGTLSLVNGAQWMLLSGTFTNMSTIIGDGTFTGALNNEGVLKPGHSPGRIKNIGPYTQTSVGTLQTQVGGTTAATGYDQLEVNGSISLAGVLQVQQINNFVPVLGDSFTVLQNDTTNAITGTFSGLPEGATIPVQGTDDYGQPYSISFAISYLAGPNTHSVVLTNQTPLPTQVAATNASVQGQSSGAMVKNTGTWGDSRSYAIVTLRASLGTVVQSGTNTNGTWSWSYDTTGVPAESVPVTITADDGHGITTAANFTLNVQDTTTTAITTSPTSSVFGQVVTFTATVTPSHAGSVLSPTGKVDFKEGAMDLSPGGVTVSSGTATFTTAALSVASHTITASYIGDSNFQMSSGNDAAMPLVVGKDASRAAVKASVNPSVYGQLVTFTANVFAKLPGSGTPTGTATFLDGTATLGTATLSRSAQATFSAAGFSRANHAITAVYNGDGNFTASTSGVYGQAVNKDASVATISSAPNAAVFGQKVTFTAVLKASAPGSGTPTGTVTFKEGTAVLGSGTLQLVGSVDQVTFSTPALTVGSHTITASYAGDNNFLSSTATDSAAPQVIQKDSTTSSIKSSLNPSVLGQAVTFTAVVRASLPGSGTPTGSLTFKDGTSTLGQGTLSAGQATFSTSSLAVGNHSITVVYAGDNNFIGDTSGGFGQAVHAMAISVVDAFVAPAAGGALPAVASVLANPLPTTGRGSSVQATSPRSWLNGEAPLAAASLDMLFASEHRTRSGLGSSRAKLRLPDSELQCLD